jgi:hypothetical protein
LLLILNMDILFLARNGIWRYFCHHRMDSSSSHYFPHQEDWQLERHFLRWTPQADSLPDFGGDGALQPILLLFLSFVLYFHITSSRMFPFLV